MRANQWAVVAGLAVLVLLFLMFRDVRSRITALGMDPRDGAARSAMNGASHFHDAVSSGKANTVCKSTDPSAFQSMTGFPCAQFIVYLHGKLGKASGEKSASPPLVQTTRVILDMVTQYERGEAQEHFEYALNGSQATLMNYRIQADALNH